MFKIKIRVLLACFTSLLVLFHASSAQEKAIYSGSSLKVLDYPESLDSLLRQFRGKVVYIDVLASWCKPCIQELECSRRESDFFSDNQIVRLYLSIDSPEDISKCIDMLREKGQEGYFVSYHKPGIAIAQAGTNQFAKDVGPLFMSFDNGGNMGISIPQYIIVDKDGNIAEPKAARPCEIDSLKRQLASYLDLNKR